MALPQLRRKNVAGGFTPRHPLPGLRPRPHWGSVPNPVQEGGLEAGAPSWAQQHSCGEAAPVFGADPQPPQPPGRPPGCGTGNVELTMNDYT